MGSQHYNPHLDLLVLSPALVNTSCLNSSLLPELARLWNYPLLLVSVSRPARHLGPPLSDLFIDLSQAWLLIRLRLVSCLS